MADLLRMGAVGVYAPFPITANTTVNTTGSAIASTGSQACTPASMTNISVGVLLTCDTGGSLEVVQVTAVTGTTFTATFAHTHSASFAITATNVLPVGICVATTAAANGAITAGTGVVVTPDSMANIQLNMRLRVSGGTGTAEVVTVSAVTATTFTATFANNHSGAYAFYSLYESYLGPVLIGADGTSDSLKLYNGHPNDNPAGVAISTITITAGVVYYPFALKVPRGLYYSVAGTAGNYTIHYLDRFLQG